MHRKRKRSKDAEDIENDRQQKQKVDIIQKAQYCQAEGQFVLAIEAWQQAIQEAHQNLVSQRDVGWYYLSISSCYGQLNQREDQCHALQQGILATQSKLASASLKFELGQLLKDRRLLEEALQEGKGPSAALSIALLLHYDEQSPEEAIPYYRLAHQDRTANALQASLDVSPQDQVKMI